MVASFRKFGRLGNRLFLAAHLIAFSRQAEVPVALTFFSQYRDTFPYFEKDPACMFPARPPSAARRLALLGARAARLARIVPTVRFWDQKDVVFDGDDADDPRIKLMRTAPLVLFEGWLFRSRTKILSLMPELRQVFAPDERAKTTARAAIRRARKFCDLTIGVHVRWEDYRGTPQFFDLAEYLQCMKEVESILAPAKVGFVFCSSADLTAESFPPNSLVCEGGRAVDDLYTLAECDCLLGPPSTFSGWASFYGGRPMFTMKKEKHFRELSDAVVLKG